MTSSHPIAVRCDPHSIVVDGSLTVVIEGATPVGVRRAECEIARVGPFMDDFALATGGAVSTRPAALTFTLTLLALPPGLYRVVSVTLQIPDDADGPERPLRIEPRGSLFEVRAVAANARPPWTLAQEYAALLREREADYERGFGGDPDDKTLTEYRVFVLLKDCYLTQPMRVGRYTIGPIGALSERSEIELINALLSRLNLPRLVVPDDSQPESHGQPAIVADFPRLFAPSVAAAINDVAEPEMKLLASVLSLGRGSYPSTIGGVVIDKASRQMSHWTHTPQYRGNLLGGALSGEHPVVLRNRLDHARPNARLRLYLEMFLEAEREVPLEAAYFRYWSLLETVARGKGYEKRVKRTWKGDEWFDDIGRVRPIRGGADLVFELLRETLAMRRFGEDALGHRLEQPSFHSLVNIWYMHRNHFVHAGGCFPDDPTICISKRRDEAECCRRAHHEIIFTHGYRDRGSDLYFDALQETTRLVVEAQFSQPLVAPNQPPPPREPTPA